MITLLTTLELATAAHRLGITQPAARRLELIVRAIEAAPATWSREGFALDGSTALLGVYLAQTGVSRVPEALEVAPYAGGGSAAALREAIATALDSTVEGDEIVFNAAVDPLRPRKAAPENLRLTVRESRVPLLFAPPADATQLPGAQTGAILFDKLRFRISPTARPPAAVPVAYFEELVFRLLTRLAAAAGTRDTAAQDDLVHLLLRLPTETREAVAESAVPAFRSALAARGLAPHEALPLLAGRISAAMQAYDPAAVAPPGYRLDGPGGVADRIRVHDAVREITAIIEVAS